MQLRGNISCADAYADLVNCPTRWSLSLLFGFLWWSSSWRWQPHIGWCRLLWPLPRAGMAFLTHFFCKMYFLYVSWGHKTFLTGFWGVLPCQKGPKFLASVLNELVSRNWGAPLNFRKLLSTSTDKFQAYSPQRDGFQKLRGAPQFPETALQSTTTDIASTTSINDCFQMSFKQHDFQLPCFCQSWLRIKVYVQSVRSTMLIQSSLCWDQFTTLP